MRPSPQEDKPLPLKLRILSWFAVVVWCVALSIVIRPEWLDAERGRGVVILVGATVTLLVIGFVRLLAGTAPTDARRPTQNDRDDPYGLK